MMIKAGNEIVVVNDFTGIPTLFVLVSAR